MSHELYWPHLRVISPAQGSFLFILEEFNNWTSKCLHMETSKEPPEKLTNASHREETSKGLHLHLASNCEIISSHQQWELQLSLPGQGEDRRGTTGKLKCHRDNAAAKTQLWLFWINISIATSFWGISIFLRKLIMWISASFSLLLWRREFTSPCLLAPLRRLLNNVLLVHHQVLWLCIM